MTAMYPGKELEPFASRVTKLSYMGKNLTTIPGFLYNSHASHVKQLNFSHNKIKNLVGIDSFENLKEINLDNNSIDDTTSFPCMPSVQTLTLTNNNLLSLEKIISRLSSAFPSLTYLSLLGNQACPNELSGAGYTANDYQKYRLYVASHLVNLKFLDFKAISDVERVQGCHIFKIPIPSNLQGLGMKADIHGYSPLPKTDEANGEAERNLVTGKVRYRYTGKKSEGNRFIRNKDL